MSFGKLAKRTLPFLVRYRSNLEPSLPGLLGAGEVNRARGGAPSHRVFVQVEKGGGWIGSG